MPDLVKAFNHNVISNALIKKKKNKRKARKAGKKRSKRGIVYIKHLPHGFFEPQLRDYFQQFGQVTRIRLARSKKTLNSKGYAFVEFLYPEVAEIAADAMNNYIMFKHIVKSVYIPPEQIKYNYFRSAIKLVKKKGKKVMTSKSVEAREQIVEANNRLMTDEDKKKQNQAVSKKIQKAKGRLASLGLQFDIDEITKNLDESVRNPKTKKTTIKDLPLENDDEDMDDETFDPEKFDLDSEDSYEDFEYDSDKNEEIDDEEEELEKAVQKAKKATEIQKKLEKENPTKEPKADKKQAAPKAKASKKNKKANTKEPKPKEEIKVPAKSSAEEFMPLKSQKKSKAKLAGKVEKKKPKQKSTEKLKFAVQELQKEDKKAVKLVKAADIKKPKKGKGKK